jgi:hypothetical protein
MQNKSVLIAGMALSLAATASQGTEYQFIDLTPPGAAAAQVWDVNNRGQVVGSVSSAGGGSFVWQAGSFTTIAAPSGAVGYTAFSISETGVVVGSYHDTLVTDPGTGQQVPGPTKGWVRDGGVDTIITIPGASFVQPRGISPDGRYVAGYYQDASFGNVGFVLDRNTGDMVSTNAPNSRFNIAQGINASLQVAGGDTLTGLGPIGYVFDIGSGTRSNVSLPGTNGTRLRDLDNFGRFAGWATVPVPGGPSITQGVVGTVSSFEFMMFPGSAYTALQGINDAGWISGSYSDAVTGSDFRGFLAIPIPEPATWTLWLLGVGAVLAWRRRKTV